MGIRQCLDQSLAHHWWWHSGLNPKGGGCPQTPCFLPTIHSPYYDYYLLIYHMGIRYEDTRVGTEKEKGV